MSGKHRATRPATQVALSDACEDLWDAYQLAKATHGVLDERTNEAFIAWWSAYDLEES